MKITYFVHGSTTDYEDGKTWEETIATKWRHTKDWQPGWIYEI